MLCVLVSFAASAQKVKVNEYDKFVKQRRIEFEPMNLMSTDKSKVFMNLNCLGSNFFVVFSGYGWGSSAIDADHQVIFLFANDSTLAVKSTGLQSYDMGSLNNSYKHQYSIKLSDIQKLATEELVGIRKYNFKDFSDMTVSKDLRSRIAKQSTMFLDELKKAKILKSLVDIQLKDISKHIGDSVRFCSKVYSTRYFEQSENRPTLLDVNSSFSAQALTTVIWGEDRKVFNDAPEMMYNNKDVCINGVVELVNNAPQIVIRKRDQIRINNELQLADISKFIGDSVTVSGKVFSGKYFAGSETAPTLLNLGAEFPNQLLTVVIENGDRKNFMAEPENYYLNKNVTVTGKVVVFKDRPQIVVKSRDQIREAGGVASATTSKPVPNTSTASADVPVKKTVQPKSDNIIPAVNRTQDPPRVSPQEESNEIIRTPASFPGGAEALTNFLRDNLRVPDDVKEGQKKTAIARFVVNPDGSVSKLEIMQSAGRSCDQEVIRVFKLMPRWIPSTRNGVSSLVTITQPIVFSKVNTEGSF